MVSASNEQVWATIVYGPQDEFQALCKVLNSVGVGAGEGYEKCRSLSRGARSIGDMS